MKPIESYNASYPLAYYTIGSVYAFYGRNLAANAIPASTQQIKHYSEKLTSIENSQVHNATKLVDDNVNRINVSNGLSRYYAVVIGKSTSGRSSSISVMFMNQSGNEREYLIKEYAVSSSCFTDGQDLMPVSTSTNFMGNSQKPDVKVGGITKSSPSAPVVGGITRTKKPEAASLGIGSITKSAPASASRVGGITRVKK